MHMEEAKGDHQGVTFFRNFIVHTSTQNPKTIENECILPLNTNLYFDSYLCTIFMF